MWNADHINCQIALNEETKRINVGETYIVPDLVG